MSWLAFLFAAEIGYASLGNIEYTPGQAVYTELEVGIIVAELLEIGFASQCYMGPVFSLPYAPWHQDYWAWMQAYYRGFTAGWRHVCHHPVLSPARPDVGYMFGGGNVLFVRYETRKRPCR